MARQPSHMERLPDFRRDLHATDEPDALHLVAGEEKAQANTREINVEYLLPLHPCARPPDLLTLMSLPIRVSLPP